MNLRNLSIIMPWKNLGCLAFKLPKLYIDFFITPYFGMYINDEIFRRRYRLFPKFELVSVQVIDPIQAVRVFRRTLKPGMLVWDKHFVVRCQVVSYPFIDLDKFEVFINVRAVPDDPTTMVALRCIHLRPIQFFPTRTGVPANDPIKIANP